MLAAMKTAHLLWEYEDVLDPALVCSLIGQFVLHAVSAWDVSAVNSTTRCRGLAVYNCSYLHECCLEFSNRFQTMLLSEKECSVHACVCLLVFIVVYQR